MVGAQFSRVRPFKNQSLDRLRTTMSRENAKNRFRRRLQRHFFGPGLVFGRFLGSGRVPKITKNWYFDKWARPPERNFSQILLKMLAEGPPSAKNTENHRKVIENCPKIDRKSAASSVTVCLQNAGGLCQKSSINSEEKRWASYSHGKPSRGAAVSR